MTEELVRTWIQTGENEMRAAAASPAVQAPEQMENDIDARLQRLHEVADRIYDRWSEGLSRGG
jgi:hypothetical protein